MILEYGHNVIVLILEWVMTLIPPQPGLDGLIVSMETIFDPLTAGLTGLGAWMPWTVLNATAAITASLWAVAFIVRIVKSFLPTMSG